MKEIRLIEIKEDIMADNNQVSAELKADLKQKNTFLLNLMASPGAGKTSVILRTIDILKDKYVMGVIEADIDSIVDSEKVSNRGVHAVQLKTGGMCHLDATMVKEGLGPLDYAAKDLVIIENVGNLVCPAEFDTGAIKNAMILSIPEGDDKPLKYPLMFTVCDVLLVNKVDTAPVFDFDLEAMRSRVLKLNPDIKIIEVSCKTGQGISEWTAWLENEITKFRD